MADPVGTLTMESINNGPLDEPLWNPVDSKKYWHCCVHVKDFRHLIRIIEIFLIVMLTNYFAISSLRSTFSLSSLLWTVLNLLCTATSVTIFVWESFMFGNRKRMIRLLKLHCINLASFSRSCCQPYTTIYNVYLVFYFLAYLIGALMDESWLYNLLDISIKTGGDEDSSTNTAIRKTALTFVHALLLCWLVYVHWKVREFLIDCEKNAKWRWNEWLADSNSITGGLDTVSESETDTVPSNDKAAVERKNFEKELRFRRLNLNSHYPHWKQNGWAKAPICFPVCIETGKAKFGKAKATLNVRAAKSIDEEEINVVRERLLGSKQGGMFFASLHSEQLIDGILRSHQTLDKKKFSKLKADLSPFAAKCAIDAHPKSTKVRDVYFTDKTPCINRKMKMGKNESESSGSIETTLPNNIQDGKKGRSRASATTNVDQLKISETLSSGDVKKKKIITKKPVLTGAKNFRCHFLYFHPVLGTLIIVVNTENGVMKADKKSELLKQTQNRAKTMTQHFSAMYGMLPINENKSDPRPIFTPILCFPFLQLAEVSEKERSLFFLLDMKDFENLSCFDHLFSMMEKAAHEKQCKKVQYKPAIENRNFLHWLAAVYGTVSDPNSEEFSGLEVRERLEASVSQFLGNLEAGQSPVWLKVAYNLSKFNAGQSNCSVAPNEEQLKRISSHNVMSEGPGPVVETNEITTNSSTVAIEMENLNVNNDAKKLGNEAERKLQMFFRDSKLGGLLMHEVTYEGIAKMLPKSSLAIYDEFWKDKRHFEIDLLWLHPIFGIVILECKARKNNSSGRDKMMNTINKAAEQLRVDKQKLHDVFQIITGRICFDDKIETVACFPNLSLENSIIKQRIDEERSDYLEDFIAKHMLHIEHFQKKAQMAEFWLNKRRQMAAQNQLMDCFNDESMTSFAAWIYGSLEGKMASWARNAMAIHSTISIQRGPSQQERSGNSRLVEMQQDKKDWTTDKIYFNQEQSAALNLAMEKKNLILFGPPGSGKTLIIAQLAIEAAEADRPGRVLILLPTAELALVYRRIFHTTNCIPKRQVIINPLRQDLRYAASEDSCDDIFADEDVSAAWLPKGPRGSHCMTVVAITVGIEVNTRNSEIARKSLQERLGSNAYEYFTLTKVMRNTRNIVDYFKGYSTDQTLFDQVGHSIIGEAVKIESCNFYMVNTLRDACAIIAKKILQMRRTEDSIPHNAASGSQPKRFFLLSDIAIIVAHKPAVVQVKKIRAFFNENALPAGSVFDQLQNTNGKEDMIAVEDASSVLSFEWPVVFVIDASTCYYSTSLANPLIACSRAVSQLTVVRTKNCVPHSGDRMACGGNCYQNWSTWDFLYRTNNYFRRRLRENNLRNAFEPSMLHAVTLTLQLLPLAFMVLMELILNTAQLILDKSNVFMRCYGLSVFLIDFIPAVLIFFAVIDFSCIRRVASFPFWKYLAMFLFHTIYRIYKYHFNEKQLDTENFVPVPNTISGSIMVNATLLMIFVPLYELAMRQFQRDRNTNRHLHWFLTNVANPFFAIALQYIACFFSSEPYMIIFALPARLLTVYGIVTLLCGVDRPPITIDRIANKANAPNVPTPPTGSQTEEPMADESLSSTSIAIVNEEDAVVDEAELQQRSPWGGIELDDQPGPSGLQRSESTQLLLQEDEDD